MWLLRDTQLIHGRAEARSPACLTLRPGLSYLPMLVPGTQTHLRPLLSLAVKGIPHHPRLGPGDAPLHKLSVNILLHEGPGACTAALALVEEQRKVGLLHGPVHWGGRNTAVRREGPPWPRGLPTSLVHSRHQQACRGPGHLPEQEGPDRSLLRS